MNEHPTATELESLVRGDLSREQARLVVRHLLRGCESCVAQIAPYASMLLAAPAAARHAEPDARATPADAPDHSPGDSPATSPGTAKVRRSAAAPRSGRRFVSPSGAPAAREAAAAAPALTSPPAPPNARPPPAAPPPARRFVSPSGAPAAREAAAAAPALTSPPAPPEAVA